MRFSKEQEDQHLSLVRSFLRFKPDGTLAEIQRQLERNLKRQLTLGYISKVRKKILGAQTHYLDNKTMKGVIATYFDAMIGLRAYLVNIFTDDMIEANDRMKAMRLFNDIYRDAVNMVRISGVLADENGEKEFLKKEAEIAANPRALSPLPEDLRGQRDQWRVHSYFTVIFNDALFRPVRDKISENSKNEGNTDALWSCTDLR